MTGTNLIRKLVGVAFAGLAAVVLFHVTRLAIRYHEPGSLEWLALLPVALPTLALASSLLLIPNPRKARRIWRGLLWGVFIGGNACLLLLAFGLFTSLDLIYHDGTAHWGKVQIPCFWIGLPAIALGAVVGLVVGVMQRHFAKRAASP